MRRVPTILHTLGGWEALCASLPTGFSFFEPRASSLDTEYTECSTRYTDVAWRILVYTQGCTEWYIPVYQEVYRVVYTRVYRAIHHLGYIPPY